MAEKFVRKFISSCKVIQEDKLDSDHRDYSLPPYAHQQTKLHVGHLKYRKRRNLIRTNYEPTDS